uniref:BEN domain-containing protein 3-like n=1 Tax=Crassostrea virginica TaxID=6565 RepID=A0A8B8C5L7_CRAVI|nr:BEN domain-containing protein 3-like [Crassostrea virginica]
MREMLSQRRQKEIMINELDIVNQRIVASESLVRNGNITTDALMDIARKFTTRRRLSESREEDEPTIDPSGITEEYTISEPELRSRVRDSRNGGKFAVNLTRKLWPELFGEGNLRFNYSWYGGGQLNKQEMDPVRKEVCKKYVCYFFPDFKDEESWIERIVSKINECLRRTDKRKRGSITWSQHAQMMCLISTNDFWFISFNAL